MKILEDKLEKTILRRYCMIAYIFIGIVSYFTFYGIAKEIGFLNFVVISITLMAFGGIIYNRWYNRVYKIVGEKRFGMVAIVTIFNLIILPLALGSSVFVYFYFYNIEYAVLNTLSIFMGALVCQAAIDTIIKVYRKEIEAILKEKINFVVSKKQV